MKALITMAVVFAGGAAFAQPPASEKTYSVDFKDVPWASVFEWYAKQTGWKADLKAKVPGTLTIKTPPGKTYTAGQVTDLLNEALAQKGCLITLRDGAFVVTTVKDAVANPAKVPAPAPAPPPVVVCPPVVDYYECRPQPRMRLFGRYR